MGINRFYNKTNIHKNFLSCYAEAEIKEDGVYLYNYVYHTDLFLEGSEEESRELVEKLNLGLTDEEILHILNSCFCDGNERFADMIRKGIIE